ncbi:MAG: hypothetical protein Tsb002_08650 [Wenzhouxiangellaceae bacterium]
MLFCHLAFLVEQRFHLLGLFGFLLGGKVIQARGRLFAELGLVSAMVGLVWDYCEASVDEREPAH